MLDVAKLLGELDCFDKKKLQSYVNLCECYVMLDETEAAVVTSQFLGIVCSWGKLLGLL